MTLDAEAAGNMDQQIDIADPFARRLLMQYLDRRRADLARLRTALEASDFGCIEISGHNLSGSGAAYGLEPISHLGADLERAAQARQVERIREVLDRLEEFVAGVTVAGST